MYINILETIWVYMYIIYYMLHNKINYIKDYKRSVLNLLILMLEIPRNQNLLTVN